MLKNENGLKDPRDRRGLPSVYRKQAQDAPGLQEDMKPVPDSGEDIYVGCGRLKGRKAFITGGDSGIGRAVALAYAREGAEVAVNYLSTESADALSLDELLSGEGKELKLIPGDITHETDAMRIVREAYQKLDGIDILVLNAGMQQARENLEDITPGQLEETFRTNVFAPLWMIQAVYKMMPAGSCIILTASSQFYRPSEKLVDYAASKYAVVGMMRALAKKLIGQGIRVNAVCPGSTWTPLEISGGLEKKDIPDYGSDNLLERAAQPYELAGMYVFLASEEASFVTGGLYGVDGGVQSM